MKSLIPVVLRFLFAGAGSAATKHETPKPAQSIDELRQQLEKVLRDTHTPGMAVAIVHREGPEWVAGLGKADVATGRAATADTLFRIGSTSKAFASLSILKLVNEGKLSLDDPVHKLVPEVWFENRWEASDPIRRSICSNTPRAGTTCTSANTPRMLQTWDCARRSITITPLASGGSIFVDDRFRRRFSN